MTAHLPAPAIPSWPLPYENKLGRRPVAQVDLVVVHCTELPDLATAREYGDARSTIPARATAAITTSTGMDRCTCSRTRPAPQPYTRLQPALGRYELVNRGRFPDWLDFAAAGDGRALHRRPGSFPDRPAERPQTAITRSGIHRRPRGPRYGHGGRQRRCQPAGFPEARPGPAIPLGAGAGRVGLQRLQP